MNLGIIRIKGFKNRRRMFFLSLLHSHLTSYDGQGSNTPGLLLTRSHANLSHYFNIHNNRSSMVSRTERRYFNVLLTVANGRLQPVLRTTSRTRTILATFNYDKRGKLGFTGQLRLIRGRPRTFPNRKFMARSYYTSNISPRNRRKLRNQARILPPNSVGITDI